MLGTLNPVLLIFSLPEMVDVIDRKYAAELSYGDRMKLYDISSGLFNAVLGMGQVLGPIYATWATELWGFAYCCDYIAIGSLAIGICYLIFTKSYPEPIQKTKEEREELEAQMLVQAASDDSDNIELHQ